MLALIGSGEYLPRMEPVDRQLLGLFEYDPHVVCLPTAAGTEGDAMIDSWAKRGEEHFTRLGTSVESVRIWDRATANDPAYAARISAANLVYLSGGKPAYLYETLKESLAWEAITGVLQKGGLLVGCSAGAMIQGERFLGFRRSGQQAGFGLWPGVTVIPHFDEIPSAIISSMRLVIGKEATIIGIEGNTAFVQRDGQYEVFGQGVTVWSAEHKVRHTAGVIEDDILP